MTELSKEASAARIAKNVAALVNGTDRPYVMNLGVGIPTQVSNYIKNENVYIQAENGMLGVGPIAEGEQIHPQLINAGRQPVCQTDGCVFLDSVESFAMIRGGHVDATVLGAFQVDEQANVANWTIPGGKQLGVGGAMDLVSGAETVIIAMTHTNRGRLKLVKECTLPITGRGEADVIVTELAVFRFEDGGWVLRKLAPDVTREELAAVTGFRYTEAADVAAMEV